MGTRRRTAMEDARISPPWITYVKKVDALFEGDPDVIVSYDDDARMLTLLVEGQDKASAIERLLPHEVEFGNEKLSTEVVPSNSTTMEATVRKAFAGNTAVSSIETAGAGVPLMEGRTYVLFKPEVVQFFDDDMLDYDGIHSTLYQDIAREVLEYDASVSFSTELLG